jgi:Signal transduction histidine kinase
MKAENRRVSMNAKLLTVQLGSLCLALAVFFCAVVCGRYLLEHVYLSEESSLRREQQYIRDLSDYVQEKELRSTDAEELSAWARAKRYVYLVIYKGEQTVLETDGEVVDLTHAVYNNVAPVGNSLTPDLLTPDEEGRYAVAFADGVFRVSLTEYSETPYYSGITMIALTLASLTLLAVNLTYNRSLTNSIIRLSREVQRVENSESLAAIQTDREDELGDLARSVERMRRSIIQRMQGEQEALTANAGLITAISHDIRTPLTALMGYLDLLEGGQYQTEEQMKKYLSASSERARQLKSLTDELFRYFLVFGQPEREIALEEYDAVILLEQLLGEHIIRLQSMGWEVQSFPLDEECTVRVNLQYLQRVVDNLFSNVLKHGDLGRSVVVMARLEGDMLKIIVSNGIPTRPTAAESTRIGLQTCRKLLERMGGSFETRQDARRFLAEAALPAERKEKKEV